MCPNVPSLRLHILLKLKPMGESYVEDGILLYAAENENGSGDFISMSIINSFVEFKAEIMSSECWNWVNWTNEH